ncbi:E3 ubiquitin-protein ligase Topors isoform X2 [Varanus komodoensis]|nr:E3 ubiquitin-protein ligase Topors isoform X2 [Varanus komodoensis]XP_044283792.1 E3 ubiquitin-protein ligase Topors isoform X2 [Varanus komodoensis]
MDNFRDDNFSPRPDANELNQAMAVDTSPDSKCPICLDTFENVAFLDRCWHRFCFRCVQEWSKNKAECPLCKQPFHSILHSMRSEDDFKVYTVRPSETESFANPNGRRFRYRTTLTRQRRAPVYSQRNSASQRTVSPPDNGILFEGLSGQTTQQREAEMHQMIRRLASRRQASLEGRTMRQIQEAEIISFRRALYRSGTRVRSIEDGGRYRDISAEFFRRNPACLHRLVPWLKRELTVLFGAHGSLVNIVQHIIMSNVTRYDMESQAFSDDLKPFLLHRTEQFLHEFISFARCPFNIDAYDQHANYDCPAPSYEEGSRSESSIITISPDSDEPSYSAFTSGTSQAPWDDETPGPSYSSSEQVRASLTTALDTSESSDGEPSSNAAVVQAQLPANVDMNGDSCDSSDNCVIVGYVKPLAERTPELVQLSSDSAESGEARKTEEVKQVQPIQYHSFSDTDASGYASPFSIGSRDGSASNKTNVSPSSKKRKSKRSEKERSKSRESATWLQSPSTGQVDDGCSLPKRRKTESSAQRSHRERHGQKSKRKHRSMEKKKRKRDGSRHKHRKDKKRSRTRDKSLSRKSQALSLSSESAGSREMSRSRSRSNEYIRTSKSRDDDYYLKDSYESKYKCEYTFYSCNTTQDGYESSYRRRMQARAQYSRENASPDYEMQSFSERTHRSRSLRGHSENRWYYYERHRSRSRSSSRSQTPARGLDRIRSEKPSGKRKYKTRHLESAHRGSEEASSAKERSALETALVKYQGFHKKATSLDSQPELEIRHKKRKKRSRSPSVEIIYEGQATDTTRHHKKKRKREKKSRKSHVSHSPFSSPVVITINSDSDKDTGIQDNTDCNSNFSWSPTLQPNEKETESLSPLVEARDSSYGAGESENVDKDSSMTTARKEVVGETSNALVPLQGTANRHALTVTDGTSFNIVNQASAVEIQSFSQLPAVRTTLFVRLSQMLRKVSHPLDSPEQNV